MKKRTGDSLEKPIKHEWTCRIGSVILLLSVEKTHISVLRPALTNPNRFPIRRLLVLQTSSPARYFQRSFWPTSDQLYEDTKKVITTKTVG